MIVVRLFLTAALLVGVWRGSRVALVAVLALMCVATELNAWLLIRKRPPTLPNFEPHVRRRATPGVEERG